MDSPRGNGQIITQFKPKKGQWDLTDENINHIDPQSGETILHNYCQFLTSTPLHIYQYLIEIKGCSVNVQDKHNDTPVHTALGLLRPKDVDLNIISYFLHLNDIDINIKGQKGYTLLHHVCIKVNIFTLDTFKYLIEIKGANFNAQDESNNTPLHLVLHEFNRNDNIGDLKTLTYLLSLDGVDTKLKDENHFTLLHLACSHITKLPLIIFKSLIETNGSDVNALDRHDATPIHRAIRRFDTNYSGDITTLTYLLTRNGINTNTQSHFGSTTLLHSICTLVNLLPIDVFQHLIEINGGDVNIRDQNYDTPARIALRQFNLDHTGDVNVLIYLLGQKCVNVNAKDQNDCTLLHEACRDIGRLPFDIFRFLIETKNGDVTIKNLRDMTPLDDALTQFPRSGCDENILTYLLSQNGVNVNDKGFNGRTLLHTACLKIDALPFGVFKFMIETLGAKMNVYDGNNSSPLHFAIIRFGTSTCDLNVLKYLINRDGVEIASRGVMGLALLHLVCGTRRIDTPKSDIVGSQLAEDLIQRSIRQLIEETTL